MVQQAKTLGITGILLGGDSWDNSVLISENSEILEGSFFSSLFSADVTPGDLSEDADQFITAYTSIFQVPPAGGAALGYDGVRLVVQTMRRADDLTPIAIRDQLAATMDYSGATFISGYNENRHPNKSAVINQIVNGEARFYKLIEHKFVVGSGIVSYPAPDRRMVVTEQRPRLTEREFIGRIWILLFLLITLFWGCDQVQQLLAPLPDGGDEEAVKIGFLYTTPNRNNSRHGAELATMQLNEAGGVRGIPIQLIARGIPTQRFVSENINETEYVTELALELIVEEEVSAIVGPNRSTYAVVVGEIAQNHGIPMMATSATNPSVTAAGDFVFMAAFTDDFQGVAMAAFALQDLEAKTAAVLTHKGDVYSEVYRKPSLIVLLLMEVTW